MCTSVTNGASGEEEVVVVKGSLDFELLLHDALVRTTDEDDGGSPGVVVDSALARTQFIFFVSVVPREKKYQLEFHQTQRNVNAKF